MEFNDNSRGPAVVGSRVNLLSDAWARRYDSAICSSKMSQNSWIVCSCSCVAEYLNAARIALEFRRILKISCSLSTNTCSPSEVSWWCATQIHFFHYFTEAAACRDWFWLPCRDRPKFVFVFVFGPKNDEIWWFRPFSFSDETVLCVFVSCFVFAKMTDENPKIINLRRGSVSVQSRQNIQ